MAQRCADSSIHSPAVHVVIFPRIPNVEKEQEAENGRLAAILQVFGRLSCFLVFSLLILPVCFIFLSLAIPSAFSLLGS